MCFSFKLSVGGFPYRINAIVFPKYSSKVKTGVLSCFHPSPLLFMILALAYSCNSWIRRFWGAREGSGGGLYPLFMRFCSQDISGVLVSCGIHLVNSYWCHWLARRSLRWILAVIGHDVAATVSLTLGNNLSATPTDIHYDRCRRFTVKSICRNLGPRLE